MPKNRPMISPGAPAVEKWVDSHCHLDALETSPEQAIVSAFAAGVDQVITVGTDLASSVEADRLALAHPAVWAAVGVHPHDAKDAEISNLQAIKQLAGGARVVAIGEIGLDFFRNLSPPAIQMEVFRRQLEIASELDKPVVLHIRDAFAEAFEVLEEAGHRAGLVFHCFSAGPEEARRAVEIGGYVSFAGNISFKKSESIREAARQIPDDRLLIETDSPYLAPVPYRGKPNQPHFVPEVGRALADSRQCPKSEIARITRENAFRIFRLQQKASGEQ